MIDWPVIEVNGSWLVLTMDEERSRAHSIDCGQNESLARRIARLPELEAIVDKLQLSPAEKAAREEVTL